ncbi:inovirus-type Gp2 protein [Paraburkholderia sp. BCC1886]|uniref:inovirus-type Gp2 protein n=1 Tax=Paraburkholderia sp. BCC1886 TaxID=2562670 RepID=UPI001182F11E|nr:inovirus-type Gp2 protein [Paraburkholderia sp. BCC1886]
MFGKFQQEVDHGVRERIHAFMHVPGGFRRASVHEENAQLETFVRLIELVELLKKQTGDAVPLRQNPQSKRVFIPKTKFTNLLRYWIDSEPDNIQQHFPFHRLHPWLHILTEFVPKLSRHRDWLENPSLLSRAALVERVDAINQVITTTKAHLFNSETLSAASDFTRNANKNRLSLKRYTESLLDHYGPLQSLRLDLGYLDRVTYAARHLPDIAFLDMEQHRKRLIEYVRRQLAPSPVGYIWKLQHSATTSYRFHLILLFRQDDLSFAQLRGDQIGRHWVQAIAQGRGGYFNWNVPDNEFERNGTGYIRIPSELKSTIEYVTRLDRYMRLTTPVKSHTLVKGTMPKSK